VDKPLGIEATTYTDLASPCTFLRGHSALGRIGSSYVKLDNLAEAIKYFQKSLTEHRTPDILAKLNEAEKEKKRRDREAYIDPAKAEEEREKGNTFFKAGDWPEAIKCYTEAIARLPTDPRAYTNRAAAYIKLMAFPEADRDLEEAIKLDPNYGVLFCPDNLFSAQAAANMDPGTGAGGPRCSQGPHPQGHAADRHEKVHRGPEHPRDCHSP